MQENLAMLTELLKEMQQERTDNKKEISSLAEKEETDRERERERERGDNWQSKWAAASPY